MKSYSRCAWWNLWFWLLLVTIPCNNRVEAAENFKRVYINEVHPGSGGDAGWIELYNGGSTAVDLGGWFLSDTSTNPARWTFPKVGLLGGGFMVLSASGTGRTNDLADLELNFRLGKEGGHLLLSGPKTNLVAEFSYPEARADHSYGRVPGEPAITGYLSQPTRGKANQSGGNGFVSSVAFSRPGGSFSEAFSLTLSCETTNAVIRYTLDGTLPNASSPVYTAPLTITNSGCIRARAYHDTLLPGSPHGESFILLSSNVLSFKSNLPVLVMDTFGLDRAVSAHSTLAHVSIYEPTGGETSLKRTPSLICRAGFHVRGSSSAGFPQPSFAMEFIDEFNRERDRPVLGLPADSDWVLYAPNQFDPIMIHNPFIHQLSREMGHYSPRTRFVEVFLAHHPGAVSARDYFGVYVLEEKIKIGKQRVAIDKLGPADLKPPELTGGYLLKFDREGPGEMGFWAGGASMIYVDPKEAAMELPQRQPQREYIKNYLEEFNRVLRGPNWKDPVRGYRAYIDVDAWIDYHVLEVLSGNVDIFRFSTYFYKPRGGKLTFGPHWDFDRALGSIDHRDADPNRWNTGRFFDAPWWGRLFRDPDFWQLWVDRWQELRRSQFSESHLFELIDRLTGELRAAQPRERRRWGLEPRGESYQSEIDWMKSWLSQRMEFIDRQLVQPPRFDPPAGKVDPGYKLALRAANNAKIYYTLDGSDPRAAQGTISSNAVIYSGPITLESDARVVARARNPEVTQVDGPPISTPWSSAVRGNFDIAKH